MIGADSRKRSKGSMEPDHRPPRTTRRLSDLTPEQLANELTAAWHARKKTGRNICSHGGVGNARNAWRNNCRSPRRPATRVLAKFCRSSITSIAPGFGIASDNLRDGLQATRLKPRSQAKTFVRFRCWARRLSAHQ